MTALSNQDSSRPRSVSPSTPAPSVSGRRFSALQVALLAFVGLSLIVMGTVYLAISGAFWPRTGSHPTIAFSSVSVTAAVASFQVTSASVAVGPENYLVNLAVNAAHGIAAPLPVNLTLTMTVGSLPYSIAWSDADTNHLVSDGDRFAVFLPPPYVGFPSDSTFVFYLFWSDGGLVQSASWQTPPQTNKPVIAFSQVTLSSGGTVATFAVADASQAVSYANYRFNLKVNGTFGTARALGASGTGVTISVGGVTYTVTFTDVGADGTVNGGDQFAVSGLRASTQYSFVLLWNDGSQIQSRDWATP